MELRVLRYFLTVAQAESISAAAEVLHVTQPTLSRQLMELEAELGTKLFARGRKKRRMALTEAGSRLRWQAEEILALADKTLASFQGGTEEVAGEVAIGGGESRAMALVARAFQTLHQRHPGILCHLYSGNAQDVTERLDKGLLDFGVLIEPVNLEGYDYLRLPATDTWGLLLRRDHLLTSRQRMVDNEFAGWLGREGHSLDTVGTYNLLYNASLMVAAGVGCALALDGLIHTQGTPLTFRPLEPRVETHLNLVWKKYHPLSQAAERFLAQFQETLQEI